ncbi:unnamed protein product [Brachionus calyciflorus]|uniref:Phospholipase B-like n=1 Tax=Brachionus calyciflorus TaxID=104777 RepID=A0A813PQ78_9BILA|nr:unnamed protein product [Brachionus calyciflorus]
MKILILSVFLGLILANFNECVKIKKPLDIENNAKNRHSIHKITYAFKKGTELKVSQIGVKNLQIKAFDDWIARGFFDGDNYNTTGWSTLEIETNEQASDYDQAYAAGFLEGTLTKDFITLHLMNTVGDFCSDTTTSVCSRLIEFLTNNFEWLNEQILKSPDDPYWHQVNLVFAQFYGLYHGYYNVTYDLKHGVNVFDSMVRDIRPYLNFLALQLNGDMSELLASISKISDPFMAGSCSALIKLLPNNEDIYVSHVTWTEYESMLRIVKHYNFNFHLSRQGSGLIPGSEITFTSYPGILASIDDFYILNSNLVVMETTIGNSNVDLWKYVTTETNLYWVRILVANRLSYSGVNWAQWFSMHNSGTYNNEWMVVDYKLFYPGEPLRDNLFIVLEQIPGQVKWEDKTDVLRTRTYWPSYNLASYPEIYNISGTFDAYVKYGDFFSYDGSPRASIFRRDHSKVVDMESMIKLMRYNNYTQEPYAKCECNPPYTGENTISARSDLNPASGNYPFDALGHRDHGATDMKVTSFKMAQNLEFIGINGPTYDDKDVPPFEWSKADFGNTTNHFGHPDKWEFEPYHFHWKL